MNISEKTLPVVLKMCIRRNSFISLLKFRSQVLGGKGETHKLKLSKDLSQETNITSVIETVWQFQTTLNVSTRCVSLYYIPAANGDGILFYVQKV